MSKVKGSLSQKLTVSDLDDLINKVKTWFETRDFDLKKIETKDKGEKINRKYVFRKGGLSTSALITLEIKGKGNKYELHLKYTGKKSASEDIEALTKFWNILPSLVSPKLEKEERVIKCPVCGYMVTDLKVKICPQCGAKLA